MMTRNRKLITLFLAAALGVQLAVHPFQVEPAAATTNNLTISTSTSSGVDTSTSGLLVATTASAVLNATDLVNALATSPIVVRASGNITISAGIVSGSSNSLTFQAEGNIIVNDAMNISTQGGDIIFQSASAGASIGSIRLGGVNNSGGSISTQGGDIIFSGGTDVLTGFAWASSDFPNNKPSAGVAIYGYVVNAGGGDILVRGSSASGVSTRSSYIAGGSNSDTPGAVRPQLLTTGTGSITIVGQGSDNSTAINAWGVLLSGPRLETQAGQVRIEGTARAGTSVNRRGVVVGGSQIISASGDIVIEDRTTQVPTFSGTYFSGTNNFSTSGEFSVRSDLIGQDSAMTLGAQRASFASFNGNSFIAALTLGNINATNTQRLDVGHVGNTANVTVSHSLTVGGPATIHAGSIAINKRFEAVSSTMSLHATGTVSQAEQIVADELSLNGPANFQLANVNNNVGVIAGGTQGSPLGSVNFVDKQDGLAIGTVNSVDGLTATGALEIATLSGDLQVNQPVVSALATGDAVKLFANKPEVVDELGDGQILIGANGAVAVGSGARALLYSGEDAVSTGLTALVGFDNVRGQVDQLSDLTTLAEPVGSTGRFGLYRLATTLIPVVPVPPYSGPLLSSFSTRNLDACASSTVTITGSRLATVTAASVQGKRAVVVEATESRLVLNTPIGLTPGANQSLVLTSSFGVLTHQNAFNVSGGSVCSLDTTIGYWTQWQAATDTIKIYAKNPVGQGKVQFFVDGKEIAWVNAADDTDPKLRVITESGPMAGVNYLVRTVSLNPGKNRFEIRVDGVRVWRATYLPQR